MSDAFGDEHNEWIDGAIVYSSYDTDKSDSSPDLKFMIKCEVFSLYGIYSQKVLKLYYQLNPSFSRVPRSSSKPVLEKSNSLSDLPIDFTSNPLHGMVTSDVSFIPDMSSKARVLSTNVLDTRGQGRGITHVVSNFNESGHTLFNIQSMYTEAGDAVGYVQKMYKDNKSAMTRAGKLMDMYMLVVVALLFGLLIGMTLSALNSSQYASILDETLNMNRRQELSLLLSLKSREPFLIRSNYSLPTNEQTLPSLITELRDQISVIQEKADSDPIYRSTEGSEKGLWWEFGSTLPVASAHNAEDLMRLLASHSLSISQQSEPNPQNRDFLAIFRNGIGESLDTLNRTMYATINSGNNEVSYKENVILGTYLAGMAALTALLLLIFLSLLKKVNAIRKRIWKFLLQIPLVVYLTAKSSSKERLEMYHSSEVAEMGLDWDSESSRSTGSKHGLQSHVAPEWVFLITSSTVLVAALMGSLTVFYFELTADLNKFNREIPMLIYVSGLRKLALLESQFYLREFQLRTDTYFDLFPSYQKIFDYETELERQVSHMRLLDHILSFTSVTVSSAQVSLLLENSATNSFLSFGVHPAISALYIDLLASIHDPHFPGFGNDFELLESRISAVLSDLETFTHMYRDAACTQVDLKAGMHWVETLGIVGGFLAVYLGIVRFFLRKMLNRALEEWRILLYLPRQSAVEIIRLMR